MLLNRLHKLSLRQDVVLLEKYYNFFASYKRLLDAWVASYHLIDYTQHMGLLRKKYNEHS